MKGGVGRERANAREPGSEPQGCRDWRRLSGRHDEGVLGLGAAIAGPKANPEPLLAVRNLSVTFAGRGGAAPVEAVRGVSFSLDRGETLALVGESGSGKSVTALSILQLLPYPLAAHGPGSSIRLSGEELVGAPAENLRRVRGDRVAMIFQEPMTSLNPLHTV